MHRLLLQYAVLAGDRILPAVGHEMERVTVRDVARCL